MRTSRWPWRRRQAKPLARGTGSRLFLEQLEDRTLLDGTPAPLPVPTPPDVSITWQGATYTAAAGQWIVPFSNVTGPAAQQVQTVQQELAPLGPGLTVVE